jgi:hypothetical protein
MHMLIVLLTGQIWGLSLVIATLHLLKIPEEERLLAGVVLAIVYSLFGIPVLRWVLALFL